MSSATHGVSSQTGLLSTGQAHHTTSNLPAADKTGAIGPQVIAQHFASHPVCFKHLAFLTAKETKFTYENPSTEVDQQNGRRCNKNGVQWPTIQDYCTKILGSQEDFNILKEWPMEPVIIYAKQKQDDWKTKGWERTQDLSEGAVCVDDSARAALAYLYDYLFETSPECKQSFFAASKILMWLGYMVTNNGEMYNFAWLSKDYFVGHSDPRQYAEDKHFMHRDEEIAEKNQGVKLLEGNNDVKAKPYRWHNQFSIYMNDIPFDYEKPLYASKVAADQQKPTGGVAVQLETSTSTKNFAFHNVRTIWAFSVALRAIEKRKKELAYNKSDKEIRNIEIIQKFVEYHITNLINFALKNDNIILQKDSKLISALVVGLVDFLSHYEKLKKLSCHQKLEKMINIHQIQLFVDKLISVIQNELVDDEKLKTIPDKSLKGLFTNKQWQDLDWEAWGELQIYALARAYRYRRKFTHIEHQNYWQRTDQILACASYAADEFYGNIAFNYRYDHDAMKQKERLTAIKRSVKIYSTQKAYMQTPIIMGLYELAKAWRKSGSEHSLGRYRDYMKYMLNVSAWFIGHNIAGTPVYRGQEQKGYDGRGSVADGIDGFECKVTTSPTGIQKDIVKNNPYISGNHGAESTIEGLTAMIFTHHALKKHKF